MAKKQFIACVMLLVAFVLMFGSMNACSSPSDTSGQDVATWGSKYCAIASGFIRGFMIADVQPAEGSMTTVFIQHYERTADAARSAVKSLNYISVPNEAKNVHNTTVQALTNIADLADKAIYDLRKAVNHFEYVAAISEYNNGAIEEGQKIEDATKQSSARVQQICMDCVVKILP